MKKTLFWKVFSRSRIKYYIMLHQSTMDCTTIEIGLQFQCVCTAIWGKNTALHFHWICTVLHGIAQYCTAIIWGNNTVSSQYIAHQHYSGENCALFSQHCTAPQGGRIARGMLESIVPRYQLYSNPPCLSLSSKYPIFAAICSHLRFIRIYIFPFFCKNQFFPFILFPFCATLNSDAGSAKPSPATISRFARISLRNHHFLSGFLSAILWGKITFFQDFFQQFSEE